MGPLRLPSNLPTSSRSCPPRSHACLRVPVHLLHVRLPAVHKQQLRRQVLGCQRVALRGQRSLLLCRANRRAACGVNACPRTGCLRPLMQQGARPRIALAWQCAPQGRNSIWAIQAQAAAPTGVAFQLQVPHRQQLSAHSTR